MKNYAETYLHWPVDLPIDPYTGHTSCIPAQLLPAIAGAVNAVCVESRYKHDGTHGLETLSNLRGAIYMLVTGCTDSADKLYRLLDTTYNGTVYEAETIDGVTTITPAIPDVPVAPVVPISTALYDIRGLVGQGIVGDAGVPTTYFQPESIADILKQIRDNAGDWTAEEKLELLSNVASLVAAV